MRRSGLRAAEWLLLVYFVYVLVTVPSAWRMSAALVLAAALGGLLLCAYGQRHWHERAFAIGRDCFALLLLLAAYREMNWFTPAMRDYHLERGWIVWDQRTLEAWHGRALIESLGWVLPLILELSYLVVYAVGPAGLSMMYATGHGERTGRFLLIYLLGGLGAYALFPFFPSDPPRVVFPDLFGPTIVTPIRRINLWVVGGYGIHSSVFPSAHVSSSFSAAFGLWTALPEYRRIGLVALAYATMVALATIYGRYHYAVDAVAGLAVSVVTWRVAVWRTRPFSAGTLRIH